MGITARIKPLTGLSPIVDAVPAIVLTYAIIGYQHTISLSIPEKAILFMIGTIGNCPHFSTWIKALTD